MNEEPNKALVRRFIDQMWNQRQLELADQIFAPDCVTYQLRADADQPRAAHSRTGETRS